jgi:hypothetical protein
MPTVLTDPAPALYLILLAIVLVLGAILARYQDRRSLIRFGIALAVLLLLYLIDKTNESPREEAVRRIQAMAQAADQKQPDAFVEHVAETVEYRGSTEKPTRLTKAELRASPFWEMLRQWDVRVAVWDFSRDDVKAVDENTMEIGFSAKGEAQGKPIPLYMRATFRKQPDGAWKLAAFASYKFERHDEPFPIPNLGR